MDALVPVIHGIGALHGLAARRRDDDRGAVALLVAALMVVLLGLAAFVVDLGYARDLQRKAQNAADAAALAAATCMASSASGCATHEAARARADGYVAANGWDAAGTHYNFDDTTGHVAVTVQGVRAPSFFSGALGGGEPTVSARAEATWRGSVALSCVLCVLGDFQGQVGSATLGGGLLVNGALTYNNRSQGTVALTGTGSVGYSASWDGNGTFTAAGSPITPVQFTPPFADPHADLPLPPGPADGVNLAKPAVTGAGTCAPGVYTDLSGCSALTGNGVYVVVGAGPGMTGVAVQGAGAPDTLIYLTCHAAGTDTYAPCGPGNQNGAQLDGNGKASITVTSRVTGTYAGYSAIYDRGLVTEPKLAGNVALSVGGGLYGAGLTLDLRGNGLDTIAGDAVVGKVVLKGQGARKDHVDVLGRDPVVVPGGPSPVHLIR